jgi:hypothetical protein
VVAEHQSRTLLDNLEGNPARPAEPEHPDLGKPADPEAG